MIETVSFTCPTLEGTPTTFTVGNSLISFSFNEYLDLNQFTYLPTKRVPLLDLCANAGEL